MLQNWFDAVGSVGSKAWISWTSFSGKTQVRVQILQLSWSWNWITIKCFGRTKFSQHFNLRFPLRQTVNITQNVHFGQHLALPVQPVSINSITKMYQWNMDLDTIMIEKWMCLNFNLCFGAGSFDTQSLLTNCWNCKQQMNKLSFVPNISGEQHHIYIHA